MKPAATIVLQRAFAFLTKSFHADHIFTEETFAAAVGIPVTGNGSWARIGALLSAVPNPQKPGIFLTHLKVSKLFEKYLITWNEFVGFVGPVDYDQRVMDWLQMMESISALAPRGSGQTNLGHRWAICIR